MENIRFILIVAFASIMYMMWEAWQIDYGPKPEIAVIEPSIIDSKEDMPIVSTTDASAQESSALVTAENTSPVSVPVIELPSAHIIKVTTDVFALEIDTQGGTVRNLDLLQYPVEKVNTSVNEMREMVGLGKEEKNLAPIRLFNSNTENLFLAQSGLISGSGSVTAPNHKTIFSYEKDNYLLQPEEETLRVPLSWSKDGITVTKTLVFKRGSYDITLEQTVDNQSNKNWQGRQYSQLLRIPYQDDKGNTFIRTYAGGVLYTEAEKYEKISFDDMAEENLTVEAKGGWTAMIQHYFAAAWIPPANEKNHFYTKELKDWRYVIGSYSEAQTVAPNSSKVFKSELFVGPKIQPMMEKIATGLELTVDYSWLTFIGKPIYSLLNYIHGYVNNWGLAILGVTFCIKLMFFPLASYSFRSMAKMRKIQPKLKELQERFADDRQRFNTEMMEMYRKEKVNPLGGCFPILVQIPVFISLYWVLIETVEIRQAPFLGWVQDLSAQDPYFILPIVMGITMKIQQGLNPAPIDPLQAKIMRLFPIAFTIFFLFFPAGLVLYWVCNNTLSITQQWFITKQIDAEP